MRERYFKGTSTLSHGRGSQAHLLTLKKAAGPGSRLIPTGNGITIARESISFTRGIQDHFIESRSVKTSKAIVE